LKELEGVEARIGEVEKELERVGRPEEVKALVEELREKVRSLQLLEEKKRVEEELAEVEKEIEELRGADKEYERLRGEVEELKKVLERERTRLEGVRRLLREVEERAKGIEERLEKVEESIRTAQKTKRWKDIITKVLEAWISTVSEIRKMRMEAVNRALKLVWRRVYLARYSDYRDIELTQRETRGGYTYELLLKGERGWREVERLSGGERTLALLSLRIAVSYLLSGRASFLILDEPTHNLDSDLSKQFAAFLKEATNEEPLFSQIIVITHNPVFADEADVVHRFEREKTGNDPTRVIRER